MLKLLVLFFISTTFSGTAAGRNYIYDSYELDSKPIEFEIVSKTEGEIRSGDKIFEVAICDSPKFHCFYSASRIFAVPKEVKAKELVWRYQNVEFRRSNDTHVIELLGLKEPVYLITTRYERPAMEGEERHTETHYYYYSIKRGILAMGTISDNDKYGRLNFLTGYCGFAAAENCNTKN